MLFIFFRFYKQSIVNFIINERIVKVQVMTTIMKVKNKNQVYMVGINAALGSFLYGYQVVNICSLEKLFANINNLTPHQTEVYVAILTASVPFGAIIGSILLMKFILKIRPRFLMIWLDLASILSIAIQCISLSFFNLFIGRIMIGIIAGFNSGLIPKYIYGVTPESLSGSVGGLPRSLQAVGFAFGYGFGFLIDPMDIFNQYDWRMFLAFPILTCIIRAINLLIFLPYQIPTDKLSMKDIQRLQKFYYKVYENYKRDYLQKSVLSDSRKSTQSNDSQQFLSQSNKYDSRFYYIMCLVLTFSNQLSGINAILFYAKQLFLKITLQNDILSQILVLFLGIVQMIASFSGGIMMDRGNKKSFLIIGQLLMVACLFMIYQLEKFDVLVILLVFCHTIAYCFSVGPLNMYYASKMLRTPGYISVVNWVASFVVALSAKFMMSDLGIGNMCLFFSILLSICIVILLFGIPREVQQIDHYSKTQKAPQTKDTSIDLSDNIQVRKKQLDQIQFSINDSRNKSYKKLLMPEQKNQILV